MGISRPIIILALCRSGTSMVAGLLAEHGVWTGPCTPANHRNPKGYFESIPFRARLREISKTPSGPCNPVPGWSDTAERILLDNGYQGGPWLVKYSVFYWPIWVVLNPFWICVRRDPEAVAQSGSVTGFLKDRKLLQAHIDAMDHCRDKLGAVDVFSDEIIAGDYSSLEKAFDYCGLELDPVVAADFVDPSLWHY